MIGLYAWWVNQASTRGYFLKQETRTYDALLFQRSIVHLDTLKLERNLYNEVLNKRNAWYALEDRRTVLEIGKPVFADI